MTIEEHIENLKVIASDMPSDKCSDWIASLIAGINAMEELQAHREAFVKIKEEINSPNRGTCDYFIVDRIEEIINEYRPKEGDAE